MSQKSQLLFSTTLQLCSWTANHQTPTMLSINSYSTPVIPITKSPPDPTPMLHVPVPFCSPIPLVQFQITSIIIDRARVIHCKPASSSTKVLLALASSSWAAIQDGSLCPSSSGLPDRTRWGGLLFGSRGGGGDLALFAEDVGLAFSSSSSASSTQGGMYAGASSVRGVVGSESLAGASTTSSPSSPDPCTSFVSSRLRRFGKGGGGTACRWLLFTFDSCPSSLCLSGKLGAARGFRFGTGIGAVLVFLSGGGNGVPGGGSGCPRPITNGREDFSGLSTVPSSF